MFKQGLVGKGFISIERENALRLCFKPDKVKDTVTATAKSKEPTFEELQQMPIPDSIERLGHSATWQCKNCKARDDKWGMLKHALYYCRKKQDK